MELRPTRDIPILLSLASCYACHCAIVFCLGLFQEVWEKNLHFSATEVSWISGLTISFFRIPSPLIEFLIQWFQIPPYIQLCTAGLSIGAGMLTLSFATTFPCVLAASLFGLGFGCFLSILSTYTSIYVFFQDKQIPVFTSIISSAVGLAIIAISLTFEWLQSSLGWQSAFRYSTFLSVPFLFATFVLCPKINPTLKENHGTQEKQNKVVSNQILEEREGTRREEQRKLFEKEEESPRWFRVYVSAKNVLLNSSFLLHLTSYSLVSGAFKASMVHEPQRIIHLGYTMKNSAESLAINGGVQFASRLTVGLLASANLVSVIRLSQVAKLLLAVATFISVFYTNLPVQHGFMLILGACGGIINTTDVILVKDCFKEGRGIALSLLILVDSASALIATAAAGYLVDFFGNYQIAFVIYGACFVIGASCSMIMERNLKKNEPKADNLSPLPENYDIQI